VVEFELRLIKVVETCIYSSELERMKSFYVNILGLQLVSEESGRHVFLKTEKNMLLIFNPENTIVKSKSMFPVHGAMTPPAIVHFALEIDKIDYENWKRLLADNKIKIESELTFNLNTRSLYFRDPAGNLVELITQGHWPIQG
jgi:catechol-2,3-dioxygenase